MTPAWIVKLDHCYPFEEGLDWAAKVRLAENRAYGYLLAQRPGGHPALHVAFNDKLGLLNFVRAKNSPPLRPVFPHRLAPPEEKVELYWEGWDVPLEVSRARTIAREECFAILGEVLKTGELPAMLPSRQTVFKQPL